VNTNLSGIKLSVKSSDTKPV